ncbi:hypothetical protein PtA15_8A356 [Puccinia triticina]|uniref:PCI domain-containing protein n=1 Tax=Puccinia triticina TaxID=208348 RepID=A0ABY7CU00_9BASI|nr:uncharacterized protein PtA15_8A356 [Puccinia triticina]WAQ87452.1 hypothetical protein PtA15_8A356 [Puccinia triticina]
MKHYPSGCFVSDSERCSDHRLIHPREPSGQIDQSSQARDQLPIRSTYQLSYDSSLKTMEASAQADVSFELINRISHYSGRQAINRLRFLGQLCSPISLSAYELALEAIVQSTWDISLYKETLAAHNKLASANNLPLLTANEDWIDSTQDEINHTLARLENDLKHNTTNCIKDGIRSSYQALGAHYRKVGDVGSAHRVFSKAREHATTALHAAELSLASLDLALDAENFKLAQSHAAKAQGALDTLIGSLELKAAKTKTSGSISTVGIDSRDPTEKDIQRWSDRVNVVNALTSLAQGDFGRATSYFLKVGKDAGDSTGGELLATATDIAIYTTLCGLAHFDRQQLKDRLIDNLEFRSMLDSEPQLRRILNLFRENKYRGVFEYLKASLPLYQGDLYLAEQTERLMMMIQERAIGQYFGSFSSAQLSKASEVFGWPMDELEQRLVLSIRSGHLPAKLDLANAILRAHRPTPRSRLLANVTSSAKKIQHDSSAALFRLKLISADLLVRDVNQPNIPSLTPSSEPVDRSK